ncbi:MAG: ABC transporter substrate-binding protein [Bacteroidales bacterium]|nr:ABC transporter substrate-binding protein [Bacteroidales bacterium]
MKGIHYIYIAIATCNILLTACHNQRQMTSTDADTLTMRHAKFLTLIEHKDYTEAQIHNPWHKGKLLQTVLITPSHHATTKHDIAGATLTRETKRAAIFTTTHSSLIDELGITNAIAGVCETEYIANPRIREALLQGKIRDIGSAMTPNKELIINLNPDLILLSPYENASTYGNLEGLGIPIVQCADYMETSALGRAEWMRFYGRLFGKGQEADSIFNAVEASYTSLSLLTDSVTHRPSVLFDTKNGSAWYVPGGRSTMAQLINDAGGEYIFSDDDKSGSIPLSFESVINRGEKADFWFIRYNNSNQRIALSDLGRSYHPYTLFNAYRKQNVYGCNSAELIFYEETPFHPDRLLRDYIKMLHPDLLPNDTLRYFHKL